MLSGAAISAAVGTTVSTAVVSAWDTGRTTISGAFSTTVGTTVSTAVVGAWDTGRATIRGAFSTTISAAVGTAVVSAWDTGRATVRGALLLVWILLWIRHASSRESNGVLRLRFRRPISTRAIFSRTARDHHIHMGQLWEQLARI
ncbi:hypothetical protein [Arthrobacter sp. ISL-95]|uniref:hypothetical protein n=1 Tax=Arthrobacter sp. ISL-95 TaxID=2819116 RepID=UPI001BEC1687|nr:hypothetical protein [Arthrobacter sp. ISL-95]MBT2585111.1 hypothetical protein [Arthrobacter sp. ISL-95]